MPSAANLHHVHPKCPDCTAARRPTALRQLGNGVPPRRDASLPLVRFLLDGDARSSFISDQANLRWLARLGDFGRLNWFAVSPTSGLPPSRSIARCLLKISTTAESGQDGKHPQSRYVQSPSMPSCSVLSPYPPVRTPPTRQARSRWRIQMLKEQKALTAGSFPFPLRSMNETAPEVTEPPPRRISLFPSTMLSSAAIPLQQFRTPAALGRLSNIPSSLSLSVARVFV